MSLSVLAVVSVETIQLTYVLVIDAESGIDVPCSKSFRPSSVVQIPIGSYESVPSRQLVVHSRVDHDLYPWQEDSFEGQLCNLKAYKN